MRNTPHILLLLTVALIMSGCGKPPVEADAGDVPVIYAHDSQAPTPQRPDEAAPMPLELPSSSEDADDAAIDTLSDQADDQAAMPRLQNDELIDVATLRPVGRGDTPPGVPAEPILAEDLAADETTGPATTLAPLPEPDVPPVSDQATIAEIPQPIYESVPRPTPAPRASPARTDTPELERPADNAPEDGTQPARRLDWGPRTDPLADLVIDETPARTDDEGTDGTSELPPATLEPTPPAANQATPIETPPAYADDTPAPQPLTSVITDMDIEATVTENAEPEDLGPAADETPEVRRQIPPRPIEPEEMYVEKVVAGVTLQVNQKTLTVDEVLAALHGELVEIPDTLSRDRFRQEAQYIISRRLMSLVQQILVAEEAEELLEDPVKQTIDAEMEETLRDLLARAGGSMERLKAQIRQEGTTLDDLLAAHRRNLLVRTYMQYKFIPAIVITRRMLWDYYRRHEDDYRTDTKVKMQILAVPFDAFLPEGTQTPTDAERRIAIRTARETIEKARKALQLNADFTQLVNQYSRGIRAEQDGLWPLMGKGNFAETPVEDAAFKLKEGQVSDIVETENGYYLVKAIEVQPGNVVGFEEAQSQIRRDLQDEQLGKLRGEHMKKMYENAVVSPPGPFVERAADRAVEKYWR